MIHFGGELELQEKEKIDPFEDTLVFRYKLILQVFVLCKPVAPA